MANVRPKLAPAIYDSVPEKGRYESDVLNDFLLHASRREIDKALEWLVERGHLRKCGDAARRLYARPERRVLYTNIRPIPGEHFLLQIHSNFEEKRP